MKNSICKGRLISSFCINTRIMGNPLLIIIYSIQAIGFIVPHALGLEEKLKITINPIDWILALLYKSTMEEVQ